MGRNAEPARRFGALEWKKAVSAGRRDRETLPGTARPDTGYLPRTRFGPQARRLLRLLDLAGPRRGRRPEVGGPAARPAAGARICGGGAGRAGRGGAQRGRGCPPVGGPTGRHADLGASPDPDQCRPAAVDPERHRVVAARHLQPEPGLRRHVVRSHADRGGRDGHGVAARRIRRGPGGRRLHVRRNGHGTLRREARHRKGVSRRDGQRRPRRR